MPTEEIYSPGLEGVIAGETGISTVSEGLHYRGYSIVELVEKCSFAEVAYLLLNGELPKAAEFQAFQDRVRGAQILPEPLRQLLRSLPRATSPMDALRTAVSVLAHFDPDVEDLSSAGNRRKSERLLGQIPVAIAEQYHASRGQPALAPRPDLSFSANILYMLKKVEPSAEETKAFDVSLILYAEHEFNASTFTTRVIMSTESDLHSAVLGGIGALKGRLHGGANERVVEMLEQAGGPENAEQWIRSALARKERIMGFGHRVYKTGDTRAKILKSYARKASESAGFKKEEEAAEIIEKVMAKEKNLLPNLDWPAGRLYHSMGLEVPLYTPLFVASRITGWCAHIIEQSENNRLIRPRARYTGPAAREVQSLNER